MKRFVIVFIMLMFTTPVFAGISVIESSTGAFSNGPVDMEIKFTGTDFTLGRQTEYLFQAFGADKININHQRQLQINPEANGILGGTLNMIQGQVATKGALNIEEKIGYTQIFGDNSSFAGVFGGAYGIQTTTGSDVDFNTATSTENDTIRLETQLASTSGRFVIEGISFLDNFQIQQNENEEIEDDREETQEEQIPEEGQEGDTNPLIGPKINEETYNMRTAFGRTFGDSSFEFQFIGEMSLDNFLLNPTTTEE